MVFSSLNFLFIFLPLAVGIHLIAPTRLKNIVLLIASLVFYAWGEPVYVVLMLLSVAFNYVTGLQIAARADRPLLRKLTLISGIAVNVAALGFFKYYGFAVDLIGGLFGLNLAQRALPLPIGISFYTFQAMSYIVDVYRGRARAQRSPLAFAVYITMFPQLVAGPIVTYPEVAARLKNRTVTVADFARGLERLVWGLGKKALLANNLGQLSEAVRQSAGRSVATAWLGAIAYALQLYFDFSGYSDMAIGMGRMLGFRFPENFDYPYTSASVTEFWRRWHMTLSGWFRNYVYIPLGGNRVGAGRHVLNLLIVWALTGLWHGASLNFVIWGLYYGALLIVEKYVTGRALARLPKTVGRALTLIAVTVGWVIFSHTDFDAMRLTLGQLVGLGAAGFADGAFLYHLRNNAALLIVGLAACTPILRDGLEKCARRAPVVSAALLALIFLASTAYLVYGSYNPFLYFRF